MPPMRKTKRTPLAKMVTIRIAADDRRVLKMLAAERGQTIAAVVGGLCKSPKWDGQ